MSLKELYDLEEPKSARNVNVDSCLHNFMVSISTCEKIFAEKQATASDSIQLTQYITELKNRISEIIPFHATLKSTGPPNNVQNLLKKLEEHSATISNDLGVPEQASPWNSESAKECVTWDDLLALTKKQPEVDMAPIINKGPSELELDPMIWMPLPERPTPTPNFDEIGKIRHIGIRSGSHGMSSKGILEVMMCKDQFSCCNTELRHSGLLPNSHYWFCDKKALGECSDFKLLHLSHFMLKQFDADGCIGCNGLDGKSIEIGFHNNSRLICDLENFGILHERSVFPKETCKLDSTIIDTKPCQKFNTFYF